jgi:hypothetical protein
MVLPENLPTSRQNICHFIFKIDRAGVREHCVLIPGLLSINVEIDRKEPAAPVPDQQSELPGLSEGSERSYDSAEVRET